MHKILVHWLVSVMVAWVPPGRKVEIFPNSWETREQALERYHAFAEDLLDVAFDPEEPPLFQGAAWAARSKTALLLAAIALKESGLRKDVDLDIGTLARGDKGKSVCSLQINVGTGTVPADGVVGTWTAKELVGGDNRKNCFRAGLHLVRRSFRACKGATVTKLAGYTSGSCDKGLQASQNRVRAYMRALERHPRIAPGVTLR